MKPELSLKSFDAAAHHSASVMLANAHYIQQKLPSMDLPDDIREKIQELSEAWIGTKQDMLSQLFDLHDVQEQGASWDELLHSSHLILKWLNDDAMLMHEVVQSLEGTGNFLAFLLVMESATHVLEANSATYEAYQEMSQHLQPHMAAVETPQKDQPS